MEIYFNDTLLNSDYYTGLSTDFKLFDNSFFLGSVQANTYTLTLIKEAVVEQPNIVTIKENGTTVAVLKVDNIVEKDYAYVYTLVDKMVDLEFKYDASEIFNEGSATLLEIALDICEKAGIELATQNFRSYDKSISWYDNTRTAREYVSFIAELNGGYAQIGDDGRLYFIKQNASSVKTIDIDECEDFNIGEQHTITRVVFEVGALKYEFGADDGDTLYLNSENVYITTQEEVQAIFNELNGFTFYSFSTSNCPIDFSIRPRSNNNIC